MAPIHSAVVGRRRTCSKCGFRQLVAILLNRETVTCRRCGARIPPPLPEGSASSATPRKRSP